MPISTPMIATTGVLTFVYSWNEYLIPLLLIRDESKYPSRWPPPTSWRPAARRRRWWPRNTPP